MKYCTLFFVSSFLNLRHLHHFECNHHTLSLLLCPIFIVRLTFSAYKRLWLRVTLVIVTALVDFIPLTVSVISAVVTDLGQWPRSASFKNFEIEFEF